MFFTVQHTAQFRHILVLSTGLSVSDWGC